MVSVWASTRTLWVAAATLSVMLAVGFSLTFNLMCWTRVFSNPGFSAVTEYVPGGMEGNRYRPLLSEVVVNWYPFCSSRRVTFAPWITDPELAVRVPLKVPKYPWPRSKAGNNNARLTKINEPESNTQHLRMTTS